MQQIYNTYNLNLINKNTQKYISNNMHKQKKQKKQKQKLSDKFKEISQQQLRKQPPQYLINSIKDKTIMLDLDILQADDIIYLGILFKLSIAKIHLYCEEGRKIGNNVAIYGNIKFKDVIKQIGNVIVCSETCKSLSFQRVPLTIRHLILLKQSISDSQHLKQLSFKYCNFTDQHLQTIKTAVAKNQSLVILDLSNNKLCNIGGMIGKIMSEHSARRDQLIWFASLRSQPLHDDLSKKGLCQVNLQNNQLNDHTVVELVSFLKDDQWTRCLNLKDNKIMENGIRQFAKLMKKNSSLISLDLRGNPGFTKQYSVYIFKKLKQNIQKYRQQKQNLASTKKVQQQQQSPQTNISDTNKHKSLQQSRRQSLYKKTQSPVLQFTISHNNITSLAKSTKKLMNKNKIQKILDEEGCKKCKKITLDMLKISKNNLDLQIQIKKLKHILLTKNIDISAILPNSHTYINHNNSMDPMQRILQLQMSNNNYLNPHNINNNTNVNGGTGQNDEQLINKVQLILMQLTKIMDNIEIQQYTQVNMENNISNAHSLSNTIPLFVHPQQLQQLELEQSSIQGKRRDNKYDIIGNSKIQDKQNTLNKSNKKIIGEFNGISDNF